MWILIWIVLANIFVSLLAFVGILTLILKRKIFDKILLLLVSLSAGALMGGAFLHLLPEGFELLGEQVFIYTLAGFVFFFFVEKVLHWRHCHDDHCKVHTFAYMNLFGDVVHNFIDGLVVAGAFIIDLHLGIVTTLAVILHEIPQELGDFGVLIHGGFSRLKALLMNFLVALTAVLGGIVGYFFSSLNFSNYLIPIAAGGFIYISASDLVPEIRKEVNLKKAFYIFGVFILGIVLMFALRFLE